MQRSDTVRNGMIAFYDRFSSGDADAFEAGLASGDGVFVIGTAPGEGHWDRESWANAYRTQFTDLGIRLEAGPHPAGYQEGPVGFGTDTPRFVFTDGSYLPTRLTAVLREEDGDWKIVHLHFSVGVPDEDAIQPPPA